MARAVEENAALFVPWLFFSEVTNTITRNVGTGTLIPDEGETMLENIMQMPWTPLLPKWREVFHITRAMNRFQSGDSEFVAVAFDTGTVLITEDQALHSTIQNLNLPYPIAAVLTHPWGAFS